LPSPATRDARKNGSGTCIRNGVIPPSESGASLKGEMLIYPQIHTRAPLREQRNFMNYR